jgi:hypothetical protein
MRPPHADPLYRSSRWDVARRRAALLACIGIALALGAVARSADGPAMSSAAAVSHASLPAVSFGGPHNYRAGRHPTSVAVADLNGDGKRDLALANESGTVSVLLNPGSGRFKTRREYRAGLSPDAVVIADLNGDGKPDLAVANSDGNSVSVLLNKGAGRFAPKRDYGVGAGPVGVASGDLNGDRRPDLVTAGDSISVLFNAGDGSFGTKVDFETGASAVAIGDLNHDGKADLVTEASVFLNNGDGGFGPRRDYPSSDTAEDVAIADLNGDGRPDLVTVSVDGVSVLLSRADGSFGPRRDYWPRFAEALAVGDLNHDRRPDVVTSEALSPNTEDCDDEAGLTVSVLPNKGNGRLRRATTFYTSHRLFEGCDPESVAIADVAGDRKPDLVTANYVSGTVSVLVNALGRCAVPLLTDSFVRLPAAKRILQRAGCRLGAIRYAYSSVPQGGVISEAPDWGAVLRKGAKVNLVVSKGRKH